MKLQEILKDKSAAIAMKKAELKEENRELKIANEELEYHNNSLSDKNIKRQIENTVLESQIKTYLQTITDLTNEMNAIDLELSELKMRLPDIVHNEKFLDQQVGSELGLKG